MSSTIQNSPNSNPLTIVLWGQKFDCETASIFVTQFRRVGVKVKVVGINGSKSEDCHGLVLHSDMVLGDAVCLAQEASCVILPCGISAAKRLQEDPRVMAFLSTAAASGATLITCSPEVIASTALTELELPENQRSFYEQAGRLRTYATATATELLSAIVTA